jgi:dipeptidyl aminopeptidase/acylaminoacyl peptidase
VEIIRTSSQVEINEGYIAVPQEFDFPTSGSQRAYAFFYPPRNRDFSPLPNTKPPLIVISHGGPTSMTSTSLNLSLQFWTSRGFAVVDVNYGGSSGYGREYRERLRGKWGIVDVEDCINAARYLVDQGKVNPQQLIIRGGSAGGFTTLCAITFHQTFKAAASYYGISDLEGLARDTHKFESHYLDQLIAPYPQQKALYKERSPLFHADRISCPVIFFQGEEDRVVPPNQAEQMVNALRKQGVL